MMLRAAVAKKGRVWKKEWGFGKDATPGNLPLKRRLQTPLNMPRPLPDLTAATCISEDLTCHSGFIGCQSRTARLCAGMGSGVVLRVTGTRGGTQKCHKQGQTLTGRGGQTPGTPKASLQADCLLGPVQQDCPGRRGGSTEPQATPGTITARGRLQAVPARGTASPPALGQTHSCQQPQQGGG